MAWDPIWRRVGDGVYCQHGTASDVHCCNCHHGFLFDADSCHCEFEPDEIPEATMIERLLTRLFKLEEINGHARCPAYMYRWTLFQPRRPSWLKGFGVYIHKFVGDDWTRDMHDHPKRFISIGLVGKYVEVTPRGLVPATDSDKAFEVRTLYSAPWVRTFPATHIHRIELLDDRRPCWTLVIVLKTVREWGFWPKGQWMPWRKYVAPDSQAANDGRLC